MRGLRLAVRGLPHPETVAVGPDGYLYTGIARGHYQGRGPVVRVDETTGHIDVFADTGGRVLGVCPAGAEALVCCDAARGAVEWYDPAGRRIRAVHTAADLSLQRPNGCIADPEGGVWFTDSGTARAGEPTGRICYVPPRGSAAVAADGLVFPNGIGLSPDHTRLYATLTRDDTLLAFDVRGPGLLGPPQVLCTGLRSGPDGLTVAPDGAIHVALTRTARVAAVDPEGTATVLVEDPDLLRMPSHAAVDGDRVLVPSLFGDTIAVLDRPGAAPFDTDEGTQ